MSQHVSLHSVRDNVAVPAPGNPTYDPWYDDDEYGETAELYDAWYEGHYADWEWGDSEA